jgi:hypothetical protein
MRPARGGKAHSGAFPDQAAHNFPPTLARQSAILKAPQQQEGKAA